VVPELRHPPTNPESPFASFRAHHVAIRVESYEEARGWYTSKLDFRVVREWLWNGLQSAYLGPPGDDDFYLQIIGGGGPRPRTKHTDLLMGLRDAGYNHLCLRVTDIDEVVGELRGRGIEIVADPGDQSPIRSRLAVFTDPWGNFIELSQPL
jgi:lactoylglutathione lyase/glyoxylase I family protein